MCCSVFKRTKTDIASIQFLYVLSMAICFLIWWQTVRKKCKWIWGEISFQLINRSVCDTVELITMLSFDEIQSVEFAQMKTSSNPKMYLHILYFSLSLSLLHFSIINWNFWFHSCTRAIKNGTVLVCLNLFTVIIKSDHKNQSTRY